MRRGGEKPLQRDAAARRDRGFALLIVLWTLVLIAFIVAHLTATGRTEIRIADNLASDAVAGAAADGAIYQTIYDLSEPRLMRQWPLDGSPRAVEIGDSRVIVNVRDEAGRINPNSSAPALMAALLQVTGTDRRTASRLANAIAQWVGRGAGASRDALLAEYRAAGLDYGPPLSPLESLSELRRVIGITPAIYAAIRPHLSLYGPPQPNPQSADPIVAAALSLLPPTAQVAGFVSSPGVPAIPRIITVRIRATAIGPGNARVERAAVVRIGAMLPGGYIILARNSRAD